MSQLQYESDYFRSWTFLTYRVSCPADKEKHYGRLTYQRASDKARRRAPQSCLRTELDGWTRKTREERLYMRNKPLSTRSLYLNDNLTTPLKYLRYVLVKEIVNQCMNKEVLRILGKNVSCYYGLINYLHYKCKVFALQLQNQIQSIFTYL